MGDNFVSPLYPFPEDSTPNSAIFKHEDPKKASHSQGIHLYKLNSGLIQG